MDTCYYLKTLQVAYRLTENKLSLDERKEGQRGRRKKDKKEGREGRESRKRKERKIHYIESHFTEM